MVRHVTAPVFVPGSIYYIFLLSAMQINWMTEDAREHRTGFCENRNL